MREFIFTHHLALLLFTLYKIDRLRGAPDQTVDDLRESGLELCTIYQSAQHRN